MWMFCTEGFLSIVEHMEMPDYFVVRARDPAPLERLLPDHEIEVIEWADYRYRITIRKERALPVLLEQIRSIDYPNYKEACKGPPSFLKALHIVWRSMLDYQREGEES